MSLVLNIILVAIMALTVFLGYRRGFVRTMIQLVGWVAALIVALTLSTPAATFAFDNFFAKGLETQLTETFNGIAGEPSAMLEQMVEKLPAPIASALENNPHVLETLENLDESTANTAQSLASSVVDTVIRPLAVSLLQFLIFLVLFLLLLVVVRLLEKLVKPICKLPLIRQADGILGAVLGALKGAVFVLLLTALLQWLVTMGVFSNWVSTDTLEDAAIVNWVLQFNPLITL